MPDTPPATSGNFTDSQLKFSYWYVTNKLVLRKWLAVFLIVISVLFGLYIGWQLIFYAIEYNIENYYIRQMIYGENYNLQTLDALEPIDLNISGSMVLGGGSGRYDFISQITNPNSGWLATFDYQYVSGDTKTYLRKGFILPKSDKYLMDLSVESRGADLEISNLKWQRFIDYDMIYNNRYRFTISNEEYFPGQELEDPNQLVFNIKNESAYNYWEVGVQVFLANSGNIISANYITLDQLKSGEDRRVELNWNTQLSNVTSFQIYPDINILDEDNIMPPDSPIGDLR